MSRDVRDGVGTGGFRDETGRTGEFRAVWRDFGLAHFQWVGGVLCRRGQSDGGYGYHLWAKTLVVNVGIAGRRTIGIHCSVRERHRTRRRPRTSSLGTGGCHTGRRARTPNGRRLRQHRDTTAGRGDRSTCSLHRPYDGAYRHHGERRWLCARQRPGRHLAGDLPAPGTRLVRAGAAAGAHRCARCGGGGPHPRRTVRRHTDHGSLRPAT